MAGDDDNEGRLSRLGRGFRKRTLGTGKTIAQLGASMAIQAVRGARDGALDESRAVAMAESMVERLDELKGLSLKLGQMASYMDTSVPPKARRVLARLQANSRAMDYGAIAGVIQEEFGAPPEEVFGSFERDPIAAASIGQVHRATTPGDGRQVAVKVQYPDIRELLTADLKTVKRMSSVALALSHVDGRGMLQEMSERLMEECDYLAEADNLRDFEAIYADTEGIDIPDLHPELSTGRVLTTSFVDRADFQSFCDSAPQQARDRAGAAIFRASFVGIFGHRMYNGDPHPGNYLFSPDGEVTLLDFGCVKRFDPDLIAGWRRLARSILANDRAAFERHWTALGFVARRRGFDFDHQLEAMRTLYQPLLAGGPFTFTDAFILEANRRLTVDNDNKFKLTLPPDWLIAQRLQLGMFSVLALLGARANFGEIFREALDLEPVDH